MSRTKRETSVDVNVVLIRNKSFFSLFVPLVFSDDFGFFFWYQIFLSYIYFNYLLPQNVLSHQMYGKHWAQAILMFAEVVFNVSSTGLLSGCSHTFHSAQFRLLVWRFFTRGSQCDLKMLPVCAPR